MKWITECTCIVFLNIGPALQGQLYHVMSSTVASNKSQQKSEIKNIGIFFCLFSQLPVTFRFRKSMNCG